MTFSLTSKYGGPYPAKAHGGQAFLRGLGLACCAGAFTTGEFMHNAHSGALTLADLGPGQSGCVVKVDDDALGHNLAAMGLVKGATVSVDRTAPMGNPRIYALQGYRLSLRNEDARKVLLRLS
jgi:ferrous iron transport protein A